MCVVQGRTLAAAAYFALSTYFMIVLMVWQQSRPLPEGTLSDVSFSMFPYLPISHLSDTLMLVSAVATLVFILFFQPHPQRVLQRLFWVWGSIYLLRAFTVVSTRLPDPRMRCLKAPMGWFTFVEAAQVMTFMSTTCSDMMFSGHTATWITFAVVWQVYHPRYSVHVLVWGYVVIGVLSLTVTRFHYLVDIVVAVYVGFTINIIYYWGVLMHEHHTPFWGLRQLIQWVDGPPLLTHSVHSRYLEVGGMRFYAYRDDKE